MNEQNDNYVRILESRVEETQTMLTRLQAAYDDLLANHQAITPCWVETRDPTSSFLVAMQLRTPLFNFANVVHDNGQWHAFLTGDTQIFPAKKFDNVDEAKKYIEDCLSVYVVALKMKFLTADQIIRCDNAGA